MRMRTRRKRRTRRRYLQSRREWIKKVAYATPVILSSFFFSAAARIWEWCDGETTREEIIEKMCDRFAATRERVAEDVGKTLASFQELGLMQ